MKQVKKSIMKMSKTILNFLELEMSITKLNHQYCFNATFAALTLKLNKKQLITEIANIVWKVDGSVKSVTESLDQ